MYGSTLIQNVSIKQQAKPRLLGLTPVSTPVQGYLPWKRSHMEVLHKCASRKSSTSGGQTHQQREERAVSVELAITWGWTQLLLKLPFTAAGSAPPGTILPSRGCSALLSRGNAILHILLPSHLFQIPLFSSLASCCCLMLCSSCFS